MPKKRNDIRHTVVLVLLVIPLSSFGQTNASLRGVVTLTGKATPLHGVTVRIVELGRAVITDEKGAYEFPQVPPDTYTVLARMDGFQDVGTTVAVEAGSIATADFQLRLLGVREQITVTASGREEVALQSFQTVTILDSVQLVGKSHSSIGEVLENQSGVAKRSFGPGSSRPVIRGFDGDRVMILQDGLRTGTVSSQSGDHGEPIDALSLERLEVVKGPATLLYGSNAIGGVVNALTGHDHPHPGLRGRVTGIGGAANAQGGGNAGFEYGVGNWLVWGGGGGQRTGDYNTPIGKIQNSKTRVRNGSGGFGWFTDRTFFSLGYGYDDGRYGVPFASQFEVEEEAGGGEAEEEQIDLKYRKHKVPIQFGFRNLESFVDGFRLSLKYTDWHHEELEGDLVTTVFDNRQFVYRGVFEQQRSASLSGSFGFEGSRRNFETQGAEALSPPVDQNGFAVFGLEEVDLQRVRLQFGGRLEHNRYDPQELKPRTFTGFSGAAGVFVPLWEGGVFVTNYTRSYRTPALEELYNNGPHIGNLTFEIGDHDLTRELGDGIEFSLRHSSSRVRGEANLYYYNLQDFVFLAPTGEIEDGLIEAEYSQADSRFLGGELGLDLGVHPNFWINLGLDVVDAQLKESNTPLPRIPPLRGRVGFEAQYKGFRIKPELLLANSQEDLFPTETRTAGYALWNLSVSYTVVQQHLVHIFSLNAFNLGNRLYRNHLSFIKDLAPEIGRGVRFGYTTRFF